MKALVSSALRAVHGREGYLDLGEVRLTEAQAATRPRDDPLRSALRHEDRAKEQGRQLVASHVHNGIVHLQLLLGVALAEVAHVVWKNCKVIRNPVLLTESDYNR